MIYSKPSSLTNRSNNLMSQNPLSAIIVTLTPSGTRALKERSSSFS